MKINDYEYLMSVAFEEAEKAYNEDEVPIGALIIDDGGNIISKARNNKETENNPCGHAEILVITEAAKALNSWRLEGCTLIVTLEPCPMCLSAALQARVDTVVFGAYDPKGGAISLGYSFHQDKRLNHKFNVVGGINHYQCSQILSQFFREKRQNYKNQQI